MSAFRQFFKRLTGAREGGTSAAAVEPKVKVEYDVSSSHPRHVIKFFIHPDDEESVKKMMAVKPPGIMNWLSNINLIAGSGDLFWKSGRTLFKSAKASSLKEVKEVLKGEGCCFSQQSERHLASLVLESCENTARLEYLEQVAEHYAKYGLTKGSPPPPVRPLPPSKQEPNGNNNGKGNGNGNGRGKGQGKGDGDGDGNGNGNGNGKGNGNGNGHGNGNGGAPALAENDTLPEPFDLPF